ncbi:hypothetical protein VIGAN_04259100, partial [Vigna angularis var. angularis]
VILLMLREALRLMLSLFDSKRELLFPLLPHLCECLDHFLFFLVFHFAWVGIYCVSLALVGTCFLDLGGFKVTLGRG